MQQNSAECASNELFDFYQTTMSIEVAVTDPYIDLREPTADFFAINSQMRLISRRQLNRKSRSFDVTGFQLTKVVYESLAPLNLPR